MEAKAKSIELIKKFENIEVHVVYTDLENDSSIATSKMATQNAVKCALIAAEELIMNTKCDIITCGRGSHYPSDREYWQEVKRELEKL